MPPAKLLAMPLPQAAELQLTEKLRQPDLQTIYTSVAALSPTCHVLTATMPDIQQS